MKLLLLPYCFLQGFCFRVPTKGGNWRNLMRTLLLTPETLGLAGTFILFIIICFVGCLVFFRRLSTLQQTILSLQMAQSEAHKTTHQLQASTEAHIQQLQAAQTVTQSTVEARIQQLQTATQATVTAT